jgi:hypothetical protein
VAWTPPFWLRRLDLVREECRQDPAFGLPPEAKLERIALLAVWAAGMLREKAARRRVLLDDLLREEALRAHRRLLSGGPHG